MDIHRIIAETKRLDANGAWQIADRLWEKAVRVAQNQPPIPFQDFKIMIYAAVKDGSDKFSDSDMSKDMSVKKPGQIGFDIAAYKAKSREIMEQAISRDANYNKFSPDQQLKILAFLDTFAKDPNALTQDTRTEAEAFDQLATDLGYKRSALNTSSDGLVCKVGENGLLNSGQLTQVDTNGARLRSDVAPFYLQMKQAAAADGITLRITGPEDGYRPLETQIRLKQEKPTLAATPGHSNHGQGAAVDIDNCNFGNPVFNWLKANANRFNFYFCEQTAKEPWHWTFKPCCHYMVE